MTSCGDAVDGSGASRWIMWAAGQKHVLLDSRGERLVFSPRRQRRDIGKADGFAAGHAGHANSEGDFTRPVAWLRDSAAHWANFQRPAGDPARVVISRALSPGAPGMDCQRMGRIGKQAQG